MIADPTETNGISIVTSSPGPLQKISMPSYTLFPGSLITDCSSPTIRIPSSRLPKALLPSTKIIEAKALASMVAMKSCAWFGTNKIVWKVLSSRSKLVVDSVAKQAG
jgi:hypothetical protein